MNKQQLQRLVELSEVCGISGFEGPVKQLLQKRLGQVAQVSYDKLGSIIFTNRQRSINKF